MGRSALSKLEEADELSRKAGKIKRKDSDVARKLEELAHRKRLSAIKQMGRRPQRKRTKLVMGVD